MGDVAMFCMCVVLVSFAPLTRACWKLMVAVIVGCSIGAVLCVHKLVNIWNAREFYICIAGAYYSHLMRMVVYANTVCMIIDIPTNIKLYNKKHIQRYENLHHSAVRQTIITIILFTKSIKQTHKAYRRNRHTYKSPQRPKQSKRFTYTKSFIKHTIWIVYLSEVVNFPTSPYHKHNSTRGVHVDRQFPAPSSTTLHNPHAFHTIWGGELMRAHEAPKPRRKSLAKCTSAVVRLIRPKLA